jgi:8-oxo-dGTP pyrophosphatase MutT (NUDIX family)
MTESGASRPPTSPRLHPRDAVAAIIVVERQGYLLQLRDNRPDIFFPDHWGLFGGAIEPGESEEAALRRELAEEIGIDIPPDAVRYVTRIDIDWNRPGCGMKTRAFFEVTLTAERVQSLILQEGADLRVFSPDEIRELRVTPYDAFGLWLHINRDRIG